MGLRGWSASRCASTSKARSPALARARGPRALLPFPFLVSPPRLAVERPPSPSRSPPRPGRGGAAIGRGCAARTATSAEAVRAAGSPGWSSAVAGGGAALSLVASADRSSTAAGVSVARTGGWSAAAACVESIGSSSTDHSDSGCWWRVGAPGGHRHGHVLPCSGGPRRPAGPLPSVRGPRRRKGRPQGVPGDGSTGPSGSEGGTDRPCRRRGGTTLGGRRQANHHEYGTVLTTAPPHTGRGSPRPSNESAWPIPAESPPRHGKRGSPDRGRATRDQRRTARPRQ